MGEAGDKAVRVVIVGYVQGVWFRAWTRQQATRLGLDGWVRNRADGAVEALFAGPVAAVDEMLRLCWQGPPLASVYRVEARPAEPPAEPGFHYRPTV
jgi:acylphosphatase